MTLPPAQHEVIRRRVVIFALLAVLAAAPGVGASVTPRWSAHELAELSTVVVIGRVTGVASAWDGTGIYTYVRLAVDEVLKGPAGGDSRELVLKQLGGVVDDLGSHVGGQAQFEVGERVLVFAEVRPRDRTLYTTALWQGKWTIEIDGATSQRSAVQRDPAMRPRELVMARQPLDELRRAVSAALVHHPEDDFVAVPIEFDESLMGTLPYARLSPAVRWLSRPITIAVQSGGQPGLAGGGLSEIRTAIAQWNGAANFSWSLGTTSARSRCGQQYAASGVVTFVHDDPCGEISNSGSIIAVATVWFTNTVDHTFNGVSYRRILEVIITSNDTPSAQSFTRSSPCYQQVMLHELGHALGLDHSAVAGAIMLPSVSYAQCSAGARGLHADDVLGAQAIYGAPSGGLTPPQAAPTNVRVTVNGSTSITITWNPVSALAAARPSAATSYRLDFRQSLNGATVASTVSADTSVVLGVPPGTTGTFNVTVTPMNSAGAGPSSAAVPFTIGGGGPCSPPSTPTGVTGHVAGSTANVSWQPSPGATSYVIRAGSGSRRADYFDGNVGNTTAVVAAVAPGFRAYVRVIAANACGLSGESSEFLLTGTGSPATHDLHVALTWNTRADMDLHMIEPSGAHVYFGNRQGPTATLDRDDLDGFGPENITVGRGRAAAGQYLVYVHNYSGQVTDATITIRLHPGGPNERTVTLTRPGIAARQAFNVALIDVVNGRITEIGGRRVEDAGGGPGKP